MGAPKIDSVRLRVEEVLEDVTDAVVCMAAGQALFCAAHTVANDRSGRAVIMA